MQAVKSMPQGISAAEEDWEFLYKKLFVLAERLMSRNGSRVAMYRSPKDLLHDCVVRYFASPNQLGWDHKRPLSKFLYGVMYNILMENIDWQGRQRIQGSTSDDAFLRAASVDPALHIDPRHNYEDRELADKLAEEVRADVALSEYMAAAAEIDEPTRRHEQIANTLDTTIADVRAREKRVRRKAEKLL